MASEPRRLLPPNGVLPTFDPAPSGRFAHQALAGANVHGALAGRLAVWAWIADESEHEITKDVDVAMPRQHLPQLVDWLERAGHSVRTLAIGGVNVRAEIEGHRVNVDFIDRSDPEWGDLSALFTDAVEEALDAGLEVDFGGVRLPVVPAEHLVAMKLATAEPRDERDAERLLSANVVDTERLRGLIGRLLGVGTSIRLETLLRRLGHPAARPRGPYKD
jgi:hypothetical protein